ncbi:la protein homolog [Eurosta solidaginis]|uniref:la protein homolog n=1 Tax=Eurosta solidaginis TaxID=178769 RepID=UPI00353138BC
MADVAEKPVEEVKNGDSPKAEDVEQAEPAAKKAKVETNAEALASTDEPEKADTDEDLNDDAKKDVNDEEGNDAKRDVNDEEGNDAKEDMTDEEGNDAKKHVADEEKSENSNNVNLSKHQRAIIRQVEYYFSDANLRRDKFLMGEISKNEDGWVPLTVLLTFKRLSALSNDANVIIDAIIKSEEGLLEISEDKQKLRRHPERPIPEHNEEQRKEIQSRTAYAKGFPLETTMSELLDFFAPYEKVMHVTMRKYLDKPSKTYKFKGSVFVTFAKKEQAQDFIEKDKVVYNDRELLRQWQEKYMEDKKEESKAKPKKGKNKKVQQDDGKIELPKGTVVHFENCTDVVSRELLREAVDKIEGDWDIAYIDYSRGEKNGHIRFAEENNGIKFLEKLQENKLKLKDDLVLVLRTLTGEEEEKYLSKAVTDMKSRRSQKNNNNKSKGGHHGHRKRHGGHHNRSDHKKSKVAKE